MGDTHDAMRAIRSKDHKLILNLMPERAWCQYSGYKEGSYRVFAEMSVLNLQQRLTPEQAAFFAAKKPTIELFDLRKDPHEVHNVADDPEYADTQARPVTALDRWREQVIEDKGVTDEFRGTTFFQMSAQTIPSTNGSIKMATTMTSENTACLAGIQLEHWPSGKRPERSGSPTSSANRTKKFHVPPST